ncbi:ribosome recycling factor [Candidatus Kuenenbacteria bacterium HGW-Kuenenbacteria-1]|uniref:Ribosome-recycling factor n=1 Tax=Candidatus Kuenenbacteria bacterium HGW-Kuenenbacteria-1 TaxID=2013812 RepID=A0A2N1UP41_9BACT|nr:MAG: ribosome recycling factor [Candidatus Kuenenbacteria bacterium HGW-Kuenenbacteria-1]
MELNLIESHKPEFEKTIIFFEKDLEKLRIGRANPALVEDLIIKAYDGQMPLKQLASINISDAKTIIIQPWDKNLLKDIEKSISISSLNLPCAVDGTMIRLNIPPMTGELRKEIVQIVHQKLEQTRVSFRQIRDEIKKEIQKQEQEKQISEDDKFYYFKELDKVVEEYNEKLKEIEIKKEKEIMTI